MMKKTAKFLSRAALLLALALPSVSMAAGIQGPRRSALERLEGSDVIRNQLMLRGSRFEASPTVGFTLGDSFKRNLLFGASLNYHILDPLAVGLTAFGSVGFNTDLGDRIEAERSERVGAFTELNMLATAELTYTPIIGKFAVFGRYVFHYDGHILAGAGVAKTGGSADVEGFSLTPVVGVGARIFLTNMIALQLQFRDYIYSDIDSAIATRDSSGNQKVSTSESWKNHFAGTLGVSFYFPSEPKNSL